MVNLVAINALSQRNNKNFDTTLIYDTSSKLTNYHIFISKILNSCKKKGSLNLINGVLITILFVCKKKKYFVLPIIS